MINLTNVIFRVLSYRAESRAEAEGSGAPLLPAAARRGALSHAEGDGRAALPQFGGGE